MGPGPLTGVDPVGRLLSKQGYRVLVEVTASLHVAKELVGSLQPSTRQVLQLVGRFFWPDGQQEDRVAVLVQVRLSIDPF